MKRLFLIAFLMLSVLFLSAQEQSGEFVGTVLLEDGSAVPGVTITVKGTNLVGARTSVSNENGKYRFPTLPPGTYSIIFTLEGFKQVVRKGVVLEVGKTLKIDGVLQAGAIQEEVLVEGATPVVDVRKSSIATNMTKDVISRLPKGRNFTGVIATQAGVDYEEGGTAGGYSFDGASASENTFFVDGMNTTTTESGVSGQRVDYDSVEEVQVKSSGYNAEYGGSMGGVVSVITKSGGNEFHGGLTFYYSNFSLNAGPTDALKKRTKVIDPETTVQEAYYQKRYKDKGYSMEPGFNLGGYIIKDRLWFFASFIPQFQKTKRPGLFDNQPEHNGETFEADIKRLKGSAKVTAAITNNLRFSLSFAMNEFKEEGILPSTFGTSDYDGSLTSLKVKRKNPTITLAGSIDYSIGNNSFLNIAGGYYRSNNYNYGDYTPAPYMHFFHTNAHLDIADDLKKSAGGVHGSWTGKDEVKRGISERLSMKADYTHYFNAGGEHVAKTGFSYTNVKLDKLNGYANDYWAFFWKDGDINDTYDHSSGEQIPVTYGYARARFYGEDGKLDTNRYSFYIQDSWTIGDKLTLNYGVRLEKENMPSMDSAHPEAAFKFSFFDKIAPRIGFAYDLNGDGKNKFFGSFGLYYDVMKLEMAVGSFGGSKFYHYYYNITDPDWTKYITAQSKFWTGSDGPVLGGELLEVQNLRQPSWDRVQPDMKPYSKMEISLGYQRSLSDDISITARFLHNRILNAIEDIGVKIGSDEYYMIGNPGSDWVNDKYREFGEQGHLPENRTCPKPKREYYSLQINLDKKFSNNWLGGFSVNLSSLKGNFSGLASTDEGGRQSPNVQRYFDAWFMHYDSQLNNADGVLPTDRPVNMKLYGAYSFDFGLTVGFNANAKSGIPVSTRLDLNGQDGYYPNGRNDQGRTPFLYQLDLYMEYAFKISDKVNMSIDVNITNVTNNKTAVGKFQHITSEEVNLNNADIAAKFNLDTLMTDRNYAKDPRYLLNNRFMNPMTVRFGAKLSF